MVSLNPVTGRDDRFIRLNISGRYSMSPANADTMLITGAGLWIGSTNRLKSNLCGGAGAHAGICFLRYPPRRG